MEDLCSIYRPKTWADVVGQNAIVSVLSRQVSLHKWKSAYLFCGQYGTGKTTIARILANEINNGEGSPIELDAASNSGVDSIRALIAEAQQSSIDCDVKTFVIDECVTGDTEVLTEYGWKRFDSLDKTEKIAQYTENGDIEFVTPYEYIEIPYTGEMYNVSIGNKASFMMSPNHVQPLIYSKSGEIKEKYVKDISFAQSNRFIRSGNGVGSLAHITDMDRLAICLQADGCLQRETETYNYWTISFKKDRKIRRIESLLASSGVEYKKLHSTDGRNRYSLKTDKSITKTLSTHFNLADMRDTYASEFIDELMQRDGYVSDGKYLYYSCVNKDNVDFCQAVSTLCGYKSRVSVEVDNRSDSYRDVYRLYMNRGYIGSPNSYVKSSAFNFKGNIYCVKVPSHMILIRKDGYEIVTGNCHQLSKAAWDAALKIIEEPPSNTVFIFCTTNPNKVPDTILSRVQRFDFRKVDKNTIADRLEFIINEGENHVSYTRDALERIASMSDGHVRNAVKYLERCMDDSDSLTVESVEQSLGIAPYRLFADIAKGLSDKDVVKSIKAVEESEKCCAEAVFFYDSLIKFALDWSIYTKTGDIYCTDIPYGYKDIVDRNRVSSVLSKRLVDMRPHCNSSNCFAFIKTICMELCE